MNVISVGRDFEAFRSAARELLNDLVAPDDVVWAGDDQPTLLAAMTDSESSQRDERGRTILEAGATALSAAPLRVSKRFMELARLVAGHRDPDRWSLLYRMLYRQTTGDTRLLDRVTDDDVMRCFSMEKSVRRDRHKMTAFVRFRQTSDERGDHYVAWHRPDHFIVRLTAPFFARRFGSMRWTILTPDESATWDGQLRFGPGVPARQAPQADDLEMLWKTYYANIFNPARVKLNAMRKEMPVRHWQTLPETELIPEMLRKATGRVEEMMSRQIEEYSTATAFMPARLTLPQLREASKVCRGCDLYKCGTQTVFGEGPADASVVLVGEQPGDQEDVQGRPFVGPAGQMLNRALDEAGVDRSKLYVTNAVKHFKWEARGKRRIHSKPSAREVQACRPWLEAELSAIKPQALVCLGATAAQALFGREFRLTQNRGKILKSAWASWSLATMHPSAILRIPEEAARQEAYQELVDDLKRVKHHLVADN